MQKVVAGWAIAGIIDKFVIVIIVTAFVDVAATGIIIVAIVVKKLPC